MVLATGNQIQVESLPADMFGRDGTPLVAGLTEGVGLSQAVTDFESTLIREALKKAGGVQKKAAEILGLKPTTLNEKIKRLGITH